MPNFILTAAWSLAALAGAPRAAELASLPSCAATDVADGSLEQTVLESTAAALGVFIAESRRLALGFGVEPIPTSVRARLAGFVPDELLERVRFTAADHPELENYLAMLGAAAVTLEDVVVFAEQTAALTNVGLWAHELRHVMQYEQCGVDGFARAYIQDSGALEEDARRYAREWHAWSLNHAAVHSTSR
jgi:hypothetical protein